jgi:predicted nucleic acid-binding protein
MAHGCDSVRLQAVRLQACGLAIQMAYLAAIVEPVEPHYLWRPTLRDPDDDMVLEAAVNGRADAIVTFNARDFGGVAGEFGIELLTPAAILRRI